MNIGLHCRLARPGRVTGIVDFLDYIKSHKKDVWVATREQIADFWYENHYPRGGGSPMKEPPNIDNAESGLNNLTMIEEKEIIFSEDQKSAHVSTSTEVEIVPGIEGGYTTLGGDAGQS